MNVWVTRDEQRDGPMSASMRRHGLSPILEPVVERHVVSNAFDEISRLGGDDWLVFTSVYTVEAVALEPARVPRVAVVGEATRRACETRGLRVELVGSTGDAAGLFSDLHTHITSGQVCFPRSSLAKPLPSWNGVDVASPVIYETVAVDFDKSVVKRVDIIAVASPSAVHAIHGADIDTNERPFACIGPTTSSTLRQLGIEPAVEATKRSFDALARAIADQRK